MSRTTPHRALSVALVAALIASGAIGLPGSPSAASDPTPSGLPLPVRGSIGEYHNPHYCNGCTPPLSYVGGPVMDTSGSAGVTVTPVYWLPADGGYAFPDDYQAIVDEYVGNVAAASGTDGNVFSIVPEYHQEMTGTRTALVYRITAGTSIIDDAAFPAGECFPSSEYTDCITDAQLRTELVRLTTREGLVTDLAHIYPVFFPADVQTQDLDGTYSGEAFCGYHRAFGTGTNEIVYGNEPFWTSGCDAGQAPNGSIEVDSAIDTLSHELSEALTDPEPDDNAWVDASGHEIGDICATNYGPALGSTSDTDPDATKYNQEIGGGRYYTQTEFSDEAFRVLGHGKGCVQNAAQVTSNPPQAAAAVATIYSYAYPNTLPADGTSTSLLQVQVGATDGSAVPGDTITYSTYPVAGSGNCGTLSSGTASTDSGGLAQVTYTASTADVTCAVVSIDAAGGQSSTGTIYQGSFQDEAITATQTFPSHLTVGNDPVTFTTTFTNPTNVDIANARVDFAIFPGDTATTDVRASQVRLSYSTTGPDGSFTRVDLSGSTITDGGISGMVGDVEGATLPALSTGTIMYRISLRANVSAKGPQPMLAFEAYLYQINVATGSGTNLADTFEHDVEVRPAN
jgi:hypothetical protein